MKLYYSSWRIILNCKHYYQTLSFVTDPTTGSAKTQTDPPAPMELLLSALTVQFFSAVLNLTDLVHINVMEPKDNSMTMCAGSAITPKPVCPNTIDVELLRG